MRFFQDFCRRKTSLKYRSADLESPLAMDKIDLRATPYADVSFNIVLCSHVLEHIPEDRLAMGEIHRVIKPGGIALIQVPIQAGKTYEDSSIIDPNQRQIHFGQADHVRIYGLDIANRLNDEGLTTEIKKCKELYSVEKIHYHGLDAEETLFIARKDTDKLYD